MDGVTLQISVAPGDLPHAREILPHQLRQWAGQVDEVLFVLDLGQNGDRPGEVEELLAELCRGQSHASTTVVDYSPAAVLDVRDRFFQGRHVPIRDCYGKVVYAYFYGLLAAANRLVLHLDSDMMFGGGSQTWVGEARRLYADRPDVFACAPLPGPPADGPLPRRIAIRHAGSRSRRARARNAVPFSAPAVGGPALRFARLSTRDLLLDRGPLRRGGARDRLDATRRARGARRDGQGRARQAPSLARAGRDLPHPRDDRGRHLCGWTSWARRPACGRCTRRTTPMPSSAPCPG